MWCPVAARSTRGGFAHETALHRGPVTELLLVLYRRLPVAAVDVAGDEGLVDFWLERVGFG
jgi:hypothetical protein